MHRRIRTTIVILCLSVSFALAQNDFRDGFIITLQNDTIVGEIDYRANAKNYKSCLFRDGNEKTEYTPNEIKGFKYLNDKYFSSQIVDDTFVEVLVKGPMSLYKDRTKYYVSKDTAFIVLESDVELVRIEGVQGNQEKSKWKGMISFLISDCLENSGAYLANIRLEEKALTKLIIKYNKCTGQVFEEHKSSKPWTQVEFGFALGITSAQAEVSSKPSRYFFLDDSYESVDPTFGLVLAFSSPRITERLAFQTEVHFLQSKFSSLIGAPSAGFFDTFIELTNLSIPLSLKYTIPWKEAGFYLQGGVNYEYALKAESRVLGEVIVGNVVNTLEETTAFDINENQVGLWGGLGYTRPLKTFNASLAIRYFQMADLSQNEGLVITNNRLSFNLILTKK